MNDSPDIPQKQCSKCEQVFPDTPEFFHRNKGGLFATCKQCRNAAGKVYNDTRVEDRRQRYQENKEEVRAKHAHYRETYREQVNAQKMRHYYEHRETINVKREHYRKTHRTEINEQKKQSYREDRGGVRTRQMRHYQEHREEMLANAARYRNAHRVEIYRRQRESHQNQRGMYLARRRAYKQKRRARLRNIAGTLTAQQIQIKMKAQKYACYYCYNKFELHKDGTRIYHLDHTIPISRPDLSPRHDANYIVLACPRCNQSKSDKLPHEWPQGGRLF